jgi:hypothetical protein
VSRDLHVAHRVGVQLGGQQLVHRQPPKAADMVDSDCFLRAPQERVNGA